MHWIQILVMLTNNSACISTIGYVVLQFIRVLTPVSKSFSLISDFQ